MEKRRSNQMTVLHPNILTKHLVFCLAPVFCIGLAGQANGSPLVADQRAQSDQDSQARGGTAVPSIGDWLYSMAINPMTDDKIILCTLKCQTGQTTLKVLFNCKKREVALSIQSAFKVSGNVVPNLSTKCLFRYDKEAPKEITLALVEDGTTILFTTIVDRENGNPVEQLKLLSNHKVLTIQIPTMRSAEYVSFSLNGFANAIARIEADSGSKINLWKELGSNKEGQ